MTNSVIASVPALALSDLNTTDNHEPRISHIRLAEMLGVADHRAILRLIERNVTELRRYGEVSVTATETSERGGRPGKTYWPNEAQALLICIRSDAPNSPDCRQQLITVFMEWRRQRDTPSIPVAAHYRRPALARADDISRLSALIDRLELQEQRGAEMPIRSGMAMVRLDRDLLLIDLSVPAGFAGTALIIDRDDGNVRLGEVCETGSPLTQMLGGLRTAMTVSRKRSGRWPCQVIGRLVDIRHAPADKPTPERGVVVSNATGEPIRLTEQEIAVALSFRLQVRDAVSAESDRLRTAVTTAITPLLAHAAGQGGAA